ncbi:PREDICTED: mitochondrial inner membrane protein COX18 isoform X1 [Sturnus vulgaris]|uniref:mitochondrial inner membrane protein COX18 isoform X1 n=1 Tax=Sturnus vulgaris TaxID=9172 RepID=UPI00071A1A2A|nr:PREDICTED: mitochondrial inner membrane protein COX18 isoform X1 [Sturnus vulgaris]XP_014740446.1 PREDICTED: mitochondrial inner membrane protein COX18 isoform X1 [Sturnus vulgaris]
MRRIVTELYVRDNCHPFKATVLLWVQVPMWVCVSLALRNCSVGALGPAVQEQFSSGGALWFTDLTAPDSTWILPVALGLVNLLVVEIFASQRKVPLSRFQKLVTHFFRAVSVVMIPIAATVPSVSTRVTSGTSPVAALFWSFKGSLKASSVSYFYCCVLKKSQMFCPCVCLYLVAFEIFLLKEEDFANLKGVDVFHVV